MGSRPRTPCLTSDIMADDDALALMIDELTLGSKRVRKLSKKVRRAQDRLRKVVKSKAWAKYMKLEQIVNHRAGEEVNLLVRWAFEAGKRHGVAVGVGLVTQSGEHDQRRT